jgi:hypothetical protein
MDEFWDPTEILPTEVPHALRNRMVHDDFQTTVPTVELWCEGVPVARYRADQIDAVACPHARHNPPVPNLPAIAAPCPLCGGRGWLDAGTAEARQVVTLAGLMGRWKGIAIPGMERIK